MKNKIVWEFGHAFVIVGKTLDDDDDDVEDLILESF
jgi:hypothetical protein